MKPGQRCTINHRHDIWCDAESRLFIDKECRIVKKTKSGLIQVELVNDSTKKYSFMQGNVDLI